MASLLGYSPRSFEAFEQLGLSAAGIDDVAAMTRKRKRSCLQSQGSEDLLSAAKNNHLLKGKRSYRRVEPSWAAMITKKAASSVHHYEPLTPYVSVSRSATLPKTTLRAEAESCTMPLDELYVKRQVPPYYTTSAVDLGRAHADLQLIRDVIALDAAPRVDRSWLGVLCDCSHTFVMRSKGDRKWVLPLHRWSTSSVLMWPMIEKSFHDIPYVYFDIDRTIGTPKYGTALSLADWEGVFFEWRSPLWQRQNAGAAAATLPSAARRVQASAEPVPLLSLAAMRGFWKLDRTIVAALAQHQGIALPPGGPSWRYVWP